MKMYDLPVVAVPTKDERAAAEVVAAQVKREDAQVVERLLDHILGVQPH